MNDTADTVSSLLDLVPDSPLLSDLTSFAQDGTSLINQIVSNGLSGTPFGETVGSFLISAVEGGLTISSFPLFQSTMSFLDQTLSDGLGDTPFANQAISLVEQAVTGGLNSGFANGLVSFLGQVAADGRRRRVSFRTACRSSTRPCAALLVISPWSRTVFPWAEHGCQRTHKL